MLVPLDKCLNNGLIREMDLFTGSANHIRFHCFLACLQRKIAQVHLLWVSGFRSIAVEVSVLPWWNVALRHGWLEADVSIRCNGLIFKNRKAQWRNSIELFGYGSWVHHAVPKQGAPITQWRGTTSHPRRTETITWFVHLLTCKKWRTAEQSCGQWQLPSLSIKTSAQNKIMQSILWFEGPVDIRWQNRIETRSLLRIH